MSDRKHLCIYAEKALHTQSIKCFECSSKADKCYIRTSSFTNYYSTLLQHPASDFAGGADILKMGTTTPVLDNLIYLIYPRGSATEQLFNCISNLTPTSPTRSRWSLSFPDSGSITEGKAVGLRSSLVFL